MIERSATFQTASMLKHLDLVRARFCCFAARVCLLGPFMVVLMSTATHANNWTMRVDVEGRRLEGTRYRGLTTASTSFHATVSC